MGGISSKNIGSFDYNTQLHIDVHFFFPVYGLHSHVRAFQHMCSTQFSSSPLDTCILSPFIQPISTKTTNLQLLQHFQRPFWHYVYNDQFPPSNFISSKLDPREFSSDDDDDDDDDVNLLDCYKPLSYILDPSNNAHRYFSAEVLQIDPELYLDPIQQPQQHQSNQQPQSLKKVKSKTQQQSQQVTNQQQLNNQHNDYYPLLFLKLSPRTYAQGTNIISFQSHYLPRNPQKLLDTSLNAIVEVNSVLPIYTFPLYPLQRDETQLYPTDPTTLKLRDRLLPHYDIAPNIQQRPEAQYQLPTPHCIKFHFIHGEHFFSNIRNCETYFKAPTHMGTILIIDFTSQESVNEFYRFLYQTQHYLQHGCIIPLIDVNLYVIGINMDKIDSLLITQQTIMNYCTQIGFDPTLIHFQSIVGEPIFAPLSKKSYGLSMNYDEYTQFSSLIWDSVWPEYFQWVKSLDQVQSDEPLPSTSKSTPIQSSTQTSTQLITHQTQLTKGPNHLNDCLFTKIVPYYKWPINFSTPILEVFPRVEDLFRGVTFYQLFSTNISPEEYINQLSLKTHRSVPEAVLFRYYMYQYIQFIQYYSNKQEPIVMISSIDIKPSYSPSVQSSSLLTYQQPTINNDNKRKIIHVENPQQFTIGRYLEQAIKHHLGSVIHPDYSSETNPFSAYSTTNQFIHPQPQFITTQDPSIQSSTLATDLSNSLNNQSHYDDADENNADDNQQNQDTKSNPMIGLPHQFNLNAFIYICPNTLISDPLGIFTIPCHRPENQQKQQQQQQQQVSKFQSSNTLPPLLQSVHTLLPPHQFDNYFPFVLERQAVITLINQIADRVIIKHFGIACPIRPFRGLLSKKLTNPGKQLPKIQLPQKTRQQILTRRIPTALPPTASIPTTPSCIRALSSKPGNNSPGFNGMKKKHVIKYDTGSISFCRDYVKFKYIWPFNSDSSTNTSKIDDLSTNAQQPNAIHPNDNSSAHSPNTPKPVQSIQLQSPLEPESYHINLSYVTRHPKSTFQIPKLSTVAGARQQYINDRLVDCTHLYQDAELLFTLPKVYTFGIQVMPFIYVREHLPLYFGEYAVGIPELCADQPELIESISTSENDIIHEIEHLEQVSLQTKEFIKTINKTRTTTNNCTIEEQFQQLYSRSTTQFTSHHIPIPCLRSTFPAAHLFMPYTSDDIPQQPKYLYEYHPFGPSRIGSTFIDLWGDNGYTFNFLHLDCPIHFVIFCVNPIVGVTTTNQTQDITRVQLQQQSIKRIQNMFQQSKPKSTPITPQSTTIFHSIDTSSYEPEEITQIEYEYLKKHIPIIYKKEFMFKLMPFITLTSIGAFHKAEEQIHFHFVGQHEWNELFEKIQTHGVHERIQYYRHNNIQSGSNNQ